MKRQILYINLLLLLISLACVCGGGDSPTPIPEVETRRPTPTPEPAGELTPERDVVEHGQNENNLEQLLSAAPFFEGDFLRVTQGGQVLMEIGQSLWLRLFNNSDLNVISVEAAENTPLDVQLFLADGGFTGELTEEGGQAQFETPNGVTVTIAGTSFYVGYNPGTAETTIVNFEGDITVNDGSRTYTLEPDFWVTSPSGSPERFRPITVEQFETTIRRAGSTDEATGVLACPDFENVTLNAEKVELGFDLTWRANGGCGPYTGTLTGTFAEQGETFATYDITQQTGNLFDQPPVQCEGTFLIVYELVLADALGRERTATAEGEVLYIC